MNLFEPYKTAMSEETKPEEIPLDEQARKAFENATFGRNLCGTALEKYTPLRRTTAQAMKMTAPNWSQSDWDAIKSDHLYPGATKDFAILFWILTRKNLADLTPDERKTEWSVEQAFARPNDAVLVAIEWAAKEGITEKPEKILAAFQLLWAIMNDISVSVFNVETEGTKAEKKSGDDSLV